MSVRSLCYWCACSVLAFITAHASGSLAAETAPFALADTSNALPLLPVPEPGRAVLLFAGMMAMAFTYRKVWLNWKRAA